MKVFLLFLLSSFLFGMFSRLPRSKKRLAVLGFGLLACMAYFAFNQV